MYSVEEIKNSLRAYIVSTGNTAIDENGIIAILDAGADRDFNSVCGLIKKVRQPFGVRREIPKWLQMLTFRLIYDCMASDKSRKQGELLSALGFNKDTFRSTSAWRMYSPEMKLRQSRFTPVDFPFSYAEVEANPIYVAMIHHMVSEASVPTNTFVDVFGKMGYVLAFCAEGYKNKLIAVHNNHTWDKYYHGITDRPTKTYAVLQEYMDAIDNILKENYNEAGRDIKIGDIVSGMDFIRNFYSNDLSIHATAKFCQMCFNKPYWEDRNVETASKERFILEDYSSIKKAKKFTGISKEEFVSYAKALKKVKCIGTSDSLISIFVENINALDIYEDYDFNEEVGRELKGLCRHETPLLYVDAPKYGEYKRFDFNSKMYMTLVESLMYYEGDWILTFKNYNHDRDDTDDDADIEVYTQNDFRQRLKESGRPLYEYRYTTTDRNIRNGISFITTINFDELTKTQFEKKYQMTLSHGEKFIKSQVN